MKPVKGSLSVFCLLILLFFSSCKKADDIGDEVDEIEISFLQRFVDGKTEPYLLCTGGKFECSGVPIAFDFYKTQDALYLNFGSTYGSPCSGGGNSSPAYAYVYLGYLTNGNYIFDITNKEQTLHALLTVEDGRYTVSKCTGETVLFKEDPAICHMVPKDAIWGYVRSVPASNADYFLDSLHSLNATSYLPLLEEAYYSYFEIRNGDVIIQGESGPAITTFILKSELDTTTLRNVMTYYCQSGLIDEINVRTGTGIIMTQY